MPLLEALAAYTGLRDVTPYHLHTTGTGSFLHPDVSGRIRSVSFFTVPAARAPVQEGRADFMPVFLSDIPALLTSGRIR